MIDRRLELTEYKNKTDAARALVSLQKIPLELTKDELFLVSISINSQWKWETLDRLSQRNTWSLATTSSAAWAIVAFPVAPSTPHLFKQHF